MSADPEYCPAQVAIASAKDSDVAWRSREGNLSLTGV
jgi:hypothetical protein